MMIVGPDEVVDEQVYLWMKAKGIEQVKQMMIKWFGQRVIWGEVEGSILIQVFYKLAVGLEQWRRDSRGKGSGRGGAERSGRGGAERRRGRGEGGGGEGRGGGRRSGRG